MNKSRITSSLLLICCFFTIAAYAENDAFFELPESQETEILVQAVNREVDAGNVDAGGIEETFQFWVEAEVDKVNLSCLVSDLQLGKGANDSKGVALDASRGCRIEAADAFSVSGKTWEIVDFKNESRKIDGNLNAKKSDYVTFRTFDAGGFKRSVFITVSWTRSPESRAVGNYQGVVKLIAEIPDNVRPPK